MLEQIAKSLAQSAPFQQTLALVRKQPQTTVTGLKGAALAFFSTFLAENCPQQVILVLADMERAEELWSDLSAIAARQEVLFFPAKEEMRRGFRLRHEQIGLQLNTINRLFDGTSQLLVTTALALIERVPAPDYLAKNRVLLQAGAEYEMDFLIEELLSFGYERSDIVSGAGEFSVRGGLVDVFPFEMQVPARVEFFGDNVESIRTFDVANQRSKRQISRMAILPPASESPEHESHAAGKLLDFVHADTVLILDGCEQFEGRVSAMAQRIAGKDETEEFSLIPGDDLMRAWRDLQDTLAGFRRVEHPHLGAKATAAVDFNMRVSQPYKGDLRRLREDLAHSPEGNGKPWTHFVLLEEQFEVDRMQELFQGEGEERIRMGRAVVHNGFMAPEPGLSVVTEKDIFGRIPQKKNWRKYRAGVPQAKLNTLTPMNLVVHVDHGIGRYLGLDKIKVAGFDRECLKVQYRDGDLLYVNIDQLWRLTKYTGAEGALPDLNRLGGRDWEKIKAKAQKSIEKMAEGLLELYAARKTQDGFSFSQDQLWQKELEASFVYDETPDQLSTIAQVKKDMEANVPMDRLICGDVGFGKTEVALRAAFKTILDSRQVGILVPTTVLAQQHYLTFEERLSKYAVKVRHLSRFLTKPEQKKVVAGIATGEIDIVIGTHRLLSKDIQFKNLGLLIIDEEHRFGVGQKEKIKSQYPLVDVLSLTATPIPRTLYFALAGSRDMSVINSPPKERLPVISQVLPFDKKMIKQAILDEVHRGGQVFVVHNAVKSIHSVEALIKRLIPDLRTAVAHGQMSSQDLERIMTGFVDRKFDCLICTMIIEAGLDMPNVNTLIVNRADKLGLAQLYQIKGRVGRSNRQAFAYFFVPQFKYLTGNAMKRLQTIEENLELGSGLEIAMKDLEIRGAGNLLGAEQSGFINAIGFDLYCRLLEETIHELKQEDLPESVPEVAIEAIVDIDLDAYIPGDYIDVDFERVNIYQRLMALRQESDLEELSAEILDRFGPIPDPVQCLLEIAKIRIWCAKTGIEKLRTRKRDVTVYFSTTYFSSSKQELLQKLLRSIQQLQLHDLRFLHGKKFGFKFSLDKTGETLENVMSFLARLDSHSKEVVENHDTV